MDVFIGKSYKSSPTAELTKYEVKDFRTFCKTFLEECQEGEKNEHYVTIGNKYSITPGDSSANSMSYKYSDHYHRNNISQKTAWLLPFDGDTSEGHIDACIDPKRVHDTLTSLKLNHVIYTTHSHVRDAKNRWRLLIPCHMHDLGQLQPTVDKLLKDLQSNGCEDLLLSNESKTWTQPWFLPTSDNPDLYEVYWFFRGEDYDAEASVDRTYDTETNISADYKSVEDQIAILTTGGHPLHSTMRDWIHGAIKDGVAPAVIKATLHAFTATWDLKDPRLESRKKDIDRITDATHVKNQEAVEAVDKEWRIEVDDDRFYTKFPDQGGNFEKIVQHCMSWMHFPNRQIAVTTAHTLISTLGGRTYTFHEGGIVYTVLITGRSTIGKSNIKKYCIHVLNNFLLNNVSGDFIGSHFYTSSKNLVEEIKKTGTLLSVRTESGQSDKSQAGDMKRVLLYELELSTESGRGGYISSGGQNDKIPDMFSPAVTTVRESVAEIQSQADLDNQSSVSGVSGRRSHVVIDPVKAYHNENRITKLPTWFKKVLKQLYEFAVDERRKNIDEPLPDDAWVDIVFENVGYLESLSAKWVDKENKYQHNGNHFMATFYGRLNQRVPAYAGRLAIAENPKAPTITNDQIDIAEASLEAEVFAHQKQQEGVNPWTVLVNKIKALFTGDMQKTSRAIRAECGIKMLKDGAMKWKIIKRKVDYLDEYKTLDLRNGFLPQLKQRLESEGIVQMSKVDTKKLYNTGAVTYQRIT